MSKRKNKKKRKNKHKNRHTKSHEETKETPNSQKVITKEEKEELKQEGELPSKKTRKKETVQIIIVVALIAIMFGSFLIPYIWVKNERIFEYNNLTWQVEQDKDVTFYHTMFGKYYKGQAMGNHNTFLRHDPRTNDIPSKINKPSFYKNVVISTDPDLLECEKQILVTDALTQVTFALPFIKDVSYAINDRVYAIKNNRTYIACDHIPEATTVIEVVKSDISRVTEDRDGDCYFIEIAECKDNMKVAEKFILNVITELRKNQPVE